MQFEQENYALRDWKPWASHPIFFLCFSVKALNCMVILNKHLNVIFDLKCFYVNKQIVSHMKSRAQQAHTFCRFVYLVKIMAIHKHNIAVNCCTLSLFAFQDYPSAAVFNKGPRSMNDRAASVFLSTSSSLSAYIIHLVYHCNRWLVRIVSISWVLYFPWNSTASFSVFRAHI